MTTLQTLKAAVLADGTVDAGEVTQLRTEMLADGVIDRAEADVLFEINDATSGRENHASWNDFFVEAVSAHVLDDDTSPNVIDEDEATYLIDRVMADGTVDDLERRLLTTIKTKATTVHATLQAKFTELNI